MKIVDVEMSLMRCHPAQAACQNVLLYKKHHHEDIVYWGMINISKQRDIIVLFLHLILRFTMASFFV